MTLKDKLAVFAELKGSVSEKVLTSMWTDGTFGLDNSYTFYKVITDLEYGIPLEWSNYFGVPDSNCTLQLILSMYNKIYLPVRSSMDDMLSTACHQCALPTDQNTKNYMFAYIQWGVRGYTVNYMQVYIFRTRE